VHRLPRAFATAAALLVASIPALASALPPVFLPGPSESGLLEPGKPSFNARWSTGVQGSFDPALSPELVFKPMGGGELGISKAVRTTLDGHGGFTMQNGPDGTPIEASYFAGGRWGLRFIAPSGFPELGFGVGGGAVGLPVAQPGGAVVPGAPDHGYVSADFEVGASQDAGEGFVSVVARVGPSLDLHLADPAAPVAVMSFGGVGELTGGIALDKSMNLTFGVSFLIGHDGAAISADHPSGTPYAGLVGSVGFVGRPASK
jgi:hypothetical protein